MASADFTQTFPFGTLKKPPKQENLSSVCHKKLVFTTGPDSSQRAESGGSRPSPSLWHAEVKVSLSVGDAVCSSNNSSEWVSGC